MSSNKKNGKKKLLLMMYIKNQFYASCYENSWLNNFFEGVVRRFFIVDGSFFNSNERER